MLDTKAILTVETELSNQSSPELDEPLHGAKSHCRNPKQLCVALLVGQVLAGLLGVSAVCAALLSKAGVSLPLLQNIPHYLSLFLVFGLIRFGLQWKKPYAGKSFDVSFGTSEKQHLSRRWQAFSYFMAGCVDMHAFWATLAAYAYTNVTSIQLLDCLGIPTSMFLSYFVLRHRYAWTHYIGAAICLVGAIMMVGADVLAVQHTTTADTTVEHGSVYRVANQTEHGPGQTQVILGDMLACLGAILYGMSSVLQEHLTNRYGATNYLTWFALVAAVLSAFYSAILEHTQLTELVTKHTLLGRPIPIVALVYYLGYAACMFCMDAIMAYTINRISAVFINLSLLTADLYGLLAGIWLFHVPFHYLYFCSFILIITGASMFASRNAKTQKRDQF